MGLPPRTTGTFSDSVEQLPNLAPVRPTQESLAPAASNSEILDASIARQRIDNSDFSTRWLAEGYAPILEALGADQRDNPAYFHETAAASLWLGTTQAEQEGKIFALIHARRMKDPSFLKDLPATPAALRAKFIADEKAKASAASATLATRDDWTATGIGFLGAAGKAMSDVPNIVTLPIGGAGKTAIGVFARETLVNGALEAIQLPTVAMNRADIGEELTAGEAVANVVVSGVAGGALESGFHVAGKALSPVAKRALDKLNEARLAASVAHADVPPSTADLFGNLDNREIVALTREVVGEDKLTPDERAAIATLERDQEVGEASPFGDNPAGNAEHGKRLGEAINDLIENRRPREFPVAPDAGAGVGRAAAPERPPGAPSTAPGRPRVATTLTPELLASYKAKNRHAESGGNDQADNPRSSAQGRFQITDGTWSAYHRRLFGGDGLADKFDPAKQEAIMDAITRDSAARLEAFGYAVTEGNLYLLHFAGEAGGSRLLKADPDMPVERILDASAIKANPFLAGKSASEVIQWAHNKMGGSAAAVGPRGAAGTLAAAGDADPRIAQLRGEALALDDQIVGLTRLPDGTPVNLSTRNVPASAIGVDATRFQFKSGGDEFGVTDRLKGIKDYDAGLAGRVTLWEDEGGKLWLADGHQRHGLARRIGQENGVDIGMDAMVLRAADGVTAEDARVWAALKNIAEGTGTAVDAAKVLRDAGAAALDRLPPKSPLVRDGAALSRLSDEAFGAVYNERIPADQAAVIGHLLPDHPETHLGMVDLLIKLDPANRAQANSIVRQAIAAGFHEGEQIDLFGTSSTVASLFAEKAKILERGLARLRKMRLVHKTAAKEKDALEAVGSTIAAEQSAKEAQANAEAISIVDRLAYRAGPVADALTDAARELADGGRLGDAADRFTARIRELDLRTLDRAAPVDDRSGGELDGAGRGGDAGEADPSLFAEPGDQGQPSLAELQAATERFSDPDGPAVQQQADSLEHDLKAMLAAGEETRGQGFILHGARGEVPDLTEGYYNPANIYGGMDTFYTTDAADIASGYRRKKGEGRIYQVTERSPVNFFDMEKQLDKAELDRLFAVKEDDLGLVPMAIDEATSTGTANLREAMDEIRNLSAGEGVSRDEVQESFDTAIFNLREQGFGGMTHTGGLLTGRKPHAVKIYFDAPNQIDLADVTPAKVEAEAPVAPAAKPVDLAHLDALRLRLSHERDRLAASATDQERGARQVTVDGIEREIAGELKFLGIEEAPDVDLSDADLLAELGEAVDPAIAARDRQLIDLQAAAPLRAAGDVDQLGTIGLELFGAADQGKLSFRLDEEGGEVSAEDLLAELDADAKAIDALRKCL